MSTPTEHSRDASPTPVSGCGTGGFAAHPPTRVLDKDVALQAGPALMRSDAVGAHRAAHAPMASGNAQEREKRSATANAGAVTHNWQSMHQWVEAPSSPSHPLPQTTTTGLTLSAGIVTICRRSGSG